MIIMNYSFDFLAPNCRHSIGGMGISIVNFRQN